MVLLELGQKITNALKRFRDQPVINDDVVKSCLNEIGLALLQADVDLKLVKQLKDSVVAQYKFNQDFGSNLDRIISRAVAEELTKMLDIERKPFNPVKGKSNVVMFVGLQGSGKTTTCAKYAYYYARKGYRVAMVCADTFRAGAFDQLKQNATKIRIPFYGSYAESDPVAIAKEGVDLFRKEGFELIIVDTSGRHKQEGELFEEMKQVEKAVLPNDIIFVMDSSIGQACYSQALAFKKAVKVGSVIVTKLDGHAKGGGALSAVAATESPIIFIGLGEHFADLEPFIAGSFVKRLLGLGDLNMMVRIVKDAVNEDEQMEMMNHIQNGKFSLKDLKIQYKSALKLGPLNQFASMIPGLGNQLAGRGSEKENIDRIKRQISILDSMNKKELGGTDPINDSRKKRIARGAGVAVEEVDMMLNNYKTFKKTIENLGGMKMSDNVTNLTRNPKQIQQMLAKGLDPSMLQQMGGMDNIMNMVKQFGDMEKKGELKELNAMLKQAKNPKKK